MERYTNLANMYTEWLRQQQLREELVVANDYALKALVLMDIGKQ